MHRNFFFRQNAKALRFDALIEKRRFMYKSNMGQLHTIQLNPETILGEKLAKASTLIVSSREDTEGRALSKTAAFRCFQIHHAVSMISDEVPFRNWRGVVCNTSDHHSARSPSVIGWSSLAAPSREPFSNYIITL